MELRVSQLAGRERPGNLIWFFLITFSVTWAVYTVAGSIPVGSDVARPVRELLFLPGTIAPALVALAMTAYAEGRAGVRSLLGQILHWQVDWRLYVFAVGFLIAVKLLAALAHFVLTGDWPAFGQESILIGSSGLSVGKN